MKFKLGDQTIEVDDATITKAIEDKTEEIVVTTDLVIRTPDQEKTYKENVRKEAKATAIEETVKDVKKELGLEFPGKDIKALAVAAGEKAVAEAKIEPDKQVAKIKADLEIVKTENLRLDGELKNEKLTSKQKLDQIEIDGEIQKHIPEGVTIPKEDMLLLIKSKLKIEKDDSGKIVVIGQDGQVMKTQSTADPRPLKEVTEDFFRDNQQYVKGVSGGGGGGNSGGGGGSKVKLTEYIKEQQEKGVLPASPEFIAEVQKMQKEDTIDMDA